MLPILESFKTATNSLTNITNLFYLDLFANLSKLVKSQVVRINDGAQTLYWVIHLSLLWLAKSGLPVGIVYGLGLVGLAVCIAPTRVAYCNSLLIHNRVI